MLSVPLKFFLRLKALFSEQAFEMKNLKLDLSQNNLICGDCKDWLPYVPSNSVDLIYIDPPFFSNKTYEFVSALERKSKIKIELKEAGNIVQPIGYLDKVRWHKLYSERVKEAKKQPQFIDDRLGKKLRKTIA